MDRPCSKKIIMMMKRISLLLVFVAIIIVSMLILVDQVQDPGTLWWDEGWTLDAARNWIEKGHLGHYMENQPIPVRIPVRFPVVVPVALSMKIMGVGVWQGRLPGAIFTVLTLILVVYLTSKMYNLKTGIITLILLLLYPYYLHPIITGSQVLAEMPMLFYLFSGYSLMWLAITSWSGWGIGAAMFFGIAIHAKLQVPPFWLLSIASATYLAYIKGRKRTMAILLFIAMGSAVSAVLMLLIQNQFMPDSFTDPELTKILLNTIIVVFSWPIRLQALKQTLIFALPQLIGIILSGCILIPAMFVKRIPSPQPETLAKDHKDILKVAIWTLGASWFGWYFVFAMCWLRYLFPPFFIVSPFVVVAISEATYGYDVRLLVRRISQLLLHGKITRFNILALFTLLAISVYFSVSISNWFFNFAPSTRDPIQVADFLESNIPNDSVIETFESELFFLAPEVNFHFPSDLVSMQLVRKYTLEPQLEINYDPLEVLPDYLIIGTYAKNWHLYYNVIEQDGFELEHEFNGYRIYRSVTLP